LLLKKPVTELEVSHVPFRSAHFCVYVDPKLTLGSFGP